MTKVALKCFMYEIPQVKKNYILIVEALSCFKSEEGTFLNPTV